MPTWVMSEREHIVSSGVANNELGLQKAIYLVSLRRRPKGRRLPKGHVQHSKNSMPKNSTIHLSKKHCGRRNRAGKSKKKQNLVLLSTEMCSLLLRSETKAHLEEIDRRFIQVLD